MNLTDILFGEKLSDASSGGQTTEPTKPVRAFAKASTATETKSTATVSGIGTANLMEE